ncbi:hypothetical protein [uncultured Ilyobacter sp.]|uniref:hypothetical protein n=1 Tax=uncultured Ilyobacter sp. TaxID=544433 RepID=UPI0029BFBD70|nr:hypothetical protein [uncultured Ilyobacter sp.]
MDVITLGVCKIDFTLDGGNAVEISKTLEEQDTIFTAPYETNKIKFDQLAGAQAGNHYISDEPTLTCSVELDLDTLPDLTGVYQAGAVSGLGMAAHGQAIQFGAINVHPISAGDSNTDHDIIGKRVYCVVTNQVEYKNEGKTRADLVFYFSANPEETDADYGMPFTIGTYSES